jgi:hypothetical protein
LRCTGGMRYGASTRALQPPGLAAQTISLMCYRFLEPKMCRLYRINFRFGICVAGLPHVVSWRVQYSCAHLCSNVELKELRFKWETNRRGYGRTRTNRERKSSKTGWHVGVKSRHLFRGLASAEPLCGMTSAFLKPACLLALLDVYLPPSRTYILVYISSFVRFRLIDTMMVASRNHRQLMNSVGDC